MREFYLKLLIFHLILMRSSVFIFVTLGSSCCFYSIEIVLDNLFYEKI